MRTDLKLPLLGDVMVEGTLAAWLKDDGATVTRGDALYQLETDKVSYAVEAPASGVLKQLIAAGETVPVGTVVGAVLDAAEVASAGATRPEEADAEAGEVRASPAARRLARELDVDIAALGTTRRIRSEDVAAYAAAARGAASQPGPGEAGQLAAPVAANERSQPQAGAARNDASRVAANERSQPQAGGVGAQLSPLAVDNARGAADRSGHLQLQATPAARRLARERGLTLTPSSRLLRIQDVDALLNAPAANQQLASPAGGRSQPMTGRRKVIAERMHASLQSMAQLTISMQVDVTEALRLRTQLTQLWGQDARPTITDLVSRAAILALGEHPDLNATLTDSTLTVYDDVQLGLAVDTPDGLIVPVVHNANTLALQALAATTRDLANRARDNRLGLEDLHGGTFTVTTLGSLGVDFFTPIINPPQVAILGIGRTFETLALQEGKVEPHSAMHLSLSFDHRAVDGAPAARFLGAIKRLLELPVALVVA